MTQKLGYGYQNLMSYQRPYSAEEEQALFDHFAKIRPGASLFLDNEGRAHRAKQLVPECAVVVRSYLAGEGDLYRNENAPPKAVFEWYKNTPKGLIRNILNEPDGYVSDDDLKRLAHWCAQVMDLFGNAGIPIVAPNFGEGHPDTNRLDRLEELWVAFDKWHDLHYYGCHEYGSHLGMVWNGGDHKYDMYPWRVGRFEAFVKPYLETHGHKIPNVILTEFGCDSAHDNTSFRGWKTCWTDRQYFDELQAAVSKIYNKPHYVGLCLFSYGNTGNPNTQEDWSTFDLSTAGEFHNLLEASAKAVDVPIVKTKPMPMTKPLDASNPHRQTLISNANGRMIRAGAGLDYEARGTLKSGSVLTVYDPIKTDGQNMRWQWIESTVADGWLCIDNVSFAPPPLPVDSTPIPVVTAPPSSTIDTTPAPDLSPKPYTFPVTVTVTATDQSTAEAVIDWIGKMVRQQFITLKASSAVAARIDDISDVAFEVQLPKVVKGV